MKSINNSNHQNDQQSASSPSEFENSDGFPLPSNSTNKQHQNLSHYQHHNLQKNSQNLFQRGGGSVTISNINNHTGVSNPVHSLLFSNHILNNGNQFYSHNSNSSTNSNINSFNFTGKKNDFFIFYNFKFYHLLSFHLRGWWKQLFDWEQSRTWPRTHS